MLKTNKLCNVCTQIKKNPKLLNDIYNSSWFMKGSSVSLSDLHRTYSQENGSQFSYESLLRHVKKHQFMSEKDYTSRHLRQIAKQAEKTLLKKHIESSQVWDEVINQGMERLANGELNMKTADLLKAAKDKSDYELKTKDQQLAFANMMYHFASGENELNYRKPYDRKTLEGETLQNIDPATESSGDNQARETGPDGIYYPPAWDASAPRAD